MRWTGFLVLLTTIAISGCATTVKMQVQRAPAINLNDAKTLKIEPFSVNGNLDLDLIDTKKGLMGAVANIAIDVGANKLAESSHDDIQISHREGLKREIFNNGHFKVTSGKNAEAVVDGSIKYDVKDEFQENESKDSKGNVTLWHQLTRTAKVSIQMNVSDAKGTMIGSTSLSATTKKRSQGATKDEARNRNESWSKLVTNAVDSTQDDAVRKIAPYYVWERRRLAEGKLKIIEKGNDAAADGNWTKAESLWKEAESTGGTKDQAAALYNLSIYDEKQGKLDDALDKLKKATSMVDEKDYRKQLRVIQRRIREEEILKGS